MNRSSVVETKTVTVIIPTYNREIEVVRAVKSVLDQDYDKVEIIVVDDGSTDCTKSVVEVMRGTKGLAGKHIRYYRQDNQGACAARNLGMRVATGEYLMFLDSDDWIKNGYISMQVESIESQDSQCAICDFEAIYESSGETRYFKNDRHPHDFIRDFASPSISTVLMKKNSISVGMHWNSKLKSLQDVDFFYKYFLTVDKFSYLNKPLFQYVIHEGARISDIYVKGMQYAELKESIRTYVSENEGSLVASYREIVNAYIWALRKHQAKNMLIKATPVLVKNVIKRFWHASG